MTNKITLFITCILVSVSSFGQTDIKNDTKFESRKLLNIGLGFCQSVIYDESFTLVRQNGFGPAFFVSYFQSKKKSTTIFENNLGVYRFHSDVSNSDYKISGVHSQERFAYKYLINYKIGRFLLATGPSFVVDYSQIKPEGLVINNAPLFDFNLQLKIASRVVYPIDILKRKCNLVYQLDLSLFGYNSRPDYLGFTEFSGKSKYFNRYGSYSFSSNNYFYINNGIQLEMNYDKINHFSIHLNQYYSQNNLSKPYQNLSSSVSITYSRIFTKKQ
jgi:hypothetical protein